MYTSNLIKSVFLFVCRFSDAFNYLIFLPEENHIWCGSWDLMGPLLETFYNYFKDDRSDSPLKLLLDRTSREMRQCTQCICQYHQAQELYSTEYDSSSIGPLLEVLDTLDEERISQHLKEINNRIRCGEYDIVHDSGEIVSVMFEVFPFTFLLFLHMNHLFIFWFIFCIRYTSKSCCSSRELRGKKKK